MLLRAWRLHDDAQVEQCSGFERLVHVFNKGLRFNRRRRRLSGLGWRELFDKIEQNPKPTRTIRNPSCSCMTPRGVRALLGVSTTRTLYVLAHDLEKSAS